MRGGPEGAGPGRRRPGLSVPRGACRALGQSEAGPDPGRVLGRPARGQVFQPL